MSNPYLDASPKTPQAVSSTDLGLGNILKPPRSDSFSCSHRSGSPSRAHPQSARAAGYMDAGPLDRPPTQEAPFESRDSGCRAEVALLHSKVGSLARKNRMLLANICQLQASLEHVDSELVAIHARMDASPMAKDSPVRAEEPPTEPQLGTFEPPSAWMELEGLPRGSTFPMNPGHQLPETLGASQHPGMDGGIFADLEPGFPPHDTMLVPFRKMVSYASYRLHNRKAELTAGEGVHIAKLKRALASLHPTLEPFTGREPIDLLLFLATVADGLRTLQATESVAVRLLNYLLDGDALQHYRSLSALGVRTPEPRKRFTWPHVVHAMLRRYLMEDVLQSAYERVTLASQESKEEEDTFADRLAKAARDCSHVFEERELIHHFVRGLLPSTRAVVRETVQRLPAHEKGDLTLVRRIASAEGETYWARNPIARADYKSSTANRASPTLLVPEDNNPTMDVTPEFPML